MNAGSRVATTGRLGPSACGVGDPTYALPDESGSRRICSVVNARTTVGASDQSSTAPEPAAAASRAAMPTSLSPLPIVSDR